MSIELRNEPVQARGKRTLERLTAAAIECAAEFGVERFTTADVADRAGVSIGTVYRYFEDRVALLEVVQPGRTIAAEVLAERGRQDAKWGAPKDLPDGTGATTRPLADLAWAGNPVGPAWTMTITAVELANAAKASCDIASTNGNTTYADIFLEEVFEAIAESDPVKLRAELVQVSAVAQKWIQVIDARSAA